LIDPQIKSGANDGYNSINILDKISIKRPLAGIEEDFSESDTSKDDEIYKNFKPIITEKPPK
jgi:hypothetical protein